MVAKKTPAKKTAAKKTAAKPAPTKLKVSASAKEAATKKGEPYVNVTSVELDPDNVENGAFELDWNEIFVARLVKAGFQIKNELE